MAPQARLMWIIVVAGFVLACAGSSSPNPPAAAKDSSATSPSRATEQSASRGPHLPDVSLSWAFWNRAGDLVVASKTALYKFGVRCDPPARVEASVDALVSANGTDVFVLEAGGGFTLWDAAAMKPVGPIAHPTRGRRGAISPDGTVIALDGCKKIAQDPERPTRCGELYDGKTGRHLASLVSKHDIEDLSFSANAKYVVARASNAGLTVFDAATGKAIVARPRWKRLLDVHAWNRSDLSEILADELVIGHGDVIEHVDLATGKTLGQTTMRGKTLAVFAPRTRRVVAFAGALGRVRVWDVSTNAVVRDFDVTKEVSAGADCTHCALEFDQYDEDLVWLTSAYTNDVLTLRVSTGRIEQANPHELRSPTVPSALHRVDESYDRETRSVICTLVRLDRDERRPLPDPYCNRIFGPSHRSPDNWPYPGFDPSGRTLATIYLGQLELRDVEREETICVAGVREPLGVKPKKDEVNE
jgi:hypothetical protein